MKRYLQMILFSLLFLYTSAYAEPSRKISWQSVEGAAGYYIEIKGADDNIVAAETVPGNSYDIIKLQPGEYSFRIATVNILGQRGQSTDWIGFTVEKLFIPELKSVSRRQMISSSSNRNIILSGVNFKPESRFLLRGGGTEVEIKDVEIRSGEEAVLSFKPASSMKGKYDLVVVNRGDVESVLKDAVEIVEAAEAETLFYTGFAYSVNMPVSAFSEYLATSFTGGSFFMQMSAINFGYENILLNAEIDAVRYVNNDNSKKSALTNISFGLGLDYIYPVSAAPVELVFKFITGPSYSKLTLDENLQDKEHSSMNWFAMIGAGVRYYPAGNFFIEPSCRWNTVFYTGTFFHDAGIFLGCGIRL